MKEQKAREALTVTEAAEKMGYPARTVRDWCKKGALPAIRTPGGNWEIPMSALRDRLAMYNALEDRADQMAGW